MDEATLKQRTKHFALQVINLVGALPHTPAADVIGRQVLRSATSVGANYRSACKGRSKPDFISKMGIVAEEADESIYWLELLQEAHLAPDDLLLPLLQEARELTAIFTSSVLTAQKHRAVPNQK
jgi:four helix bundle protein